MKKIRKFLKKGSGELLGFCVILPAFVELMLIIISIAQIALAKQKLEYVAYSAGRIAVTTDNYSDALHNANTVVSESLNLSSYHNAVADLTVNGTSDPNNIVWYKGVYVKVTVSFDVDTVFFSSPHYCETSIYMMVERPATS